MSRDTITSGLSAGSLLLHGGDGLDNDEFFKKMFIELAGGPDNLNVYISTAFSEEQLRHQQQINTNPEFAAKRFGLKNALILNTRDQEKAETELFIGPITKATAVFYCKASMAFNVSDHMPLWLRLTLP